MGPALESATDAPVLSGRYRLLALVGEGASARVYEAHDQRADALVAVKVLSPHLVADPIVFERFRREIQLTRHLGHSQIVSIHDLVSDADGTYLVMEYLDGPNLKDFIKLRAPVPLDVALSILRQVLEVLAVCHAKNVVHRDLKPHNLVVDADTRVKVLDFGIARMGGTSDLTQTGVALGSPEYMAPELFGANTFDPRTDLYAVGVIGFELLAGRLPFAGDSLPVLYRQHSTAPVPALRDLRPDVPPWVQQLLERLLAKQPFQRYQSADEALADMRQQRVISREVTPLPTRECVHCGERTLAEVPLCVMCGWVPPTAAQPGGLDVLCTRDQDDEKLTRFLADVLGLANAPRRRRRTLLLAGVDALAAGLVVRSAARHGIRLAARRHSPLVELEKAGLLALACFFAGGFVGTILQGVGFYGRYYVDQLDGARLLPLALFLALGAVCLRRLVQVEVRPLLPARAALARAVDREAASLRRLAPSLGAERSPAMKALVAQIIEQRVKLERACGTLDPAVGTALVQVVEGTARLAAVVSEIERALGAGRFVERSQEYVALTRATPPPGDGAEHERRRRALTGELEAYHALADRHAGVLNTLIALQAVFNRLIGRALVLRAPIGEQEHALLTASVETLAADLAVSREVQRELERLG